MTVRAANNPSRVSYYVTNEYYLELIADFTDWQDDALSVVDPAERDLARQLLEQEARLLDRLLYEEWLTLFTPECAYWIPRSRYPLMTGVGSKTGYSGSAPVMHGRKRQRHGPRAWSRM